MRIKRAIILAVVVLGAVAPRAFAQAVASASGGAPRARTAPLSLELRPGFDIPLGQTNQYFKVGGTMDINLRYRLGSTPLLVMGGLTYTFAPDRSTDSVSIATGRVGAGVELPVSKSLSFDAYGTGGYYYGTLNDFSVSSADPYLGGGLGIRLALSPSWGIGFDGVYRSYFGLYQGISAAISTTLRLGATGSGRTAQAPTAVAPAAPQPQPLNTNQTVTSGGALQIAKTSFPPVFPVFYSYYDNHPIGTIDIKNDSSDTASNLSATVYIKQFMDNPKTVALKGTVGPNATKTVDLYALFTDSVLSITEGTKVSAQITLDYNEGTKEYEDKEIETVRFLNRNAMTWDDNRRAAAFVTAKDPAVLTFAKSIVGYIRSKEVTSINSSLQTVMALHEALDLYGLNYVQDPTTPYVKMSKKRDAVDFLQFPRQTLQYKAGDCDDLSILYSALLEAVGVNAAFITVPGHIFVAVDTGLSPKQAVANLIPADQFVVHGKTAWIPVEVTLRHEGFLKAWEEGAKEWNQANPVGQAGFYPVEAAWNVYDPVGLPGTPQNVVVPSSDKVLATYLADVTKYIDQAIFPQVAKLQAQIQASGSLPAMNKLGILYAKYGQPNKAKIEFTQLLKKKSNYLPALLNLGNLAYLDQDWLNAQKYYQKASDLVPNNPHVLLAVARVNQQLENYGNVKRSYAKLAKIDPLLAQQYSYLALGSQAGSARAADIQTEQRQVLWEGE